MRIISYLLEMKYEISFFLLLCGYEKINVDIYIDCFNFDLI